MTHCNRCQTPTECEERGCAFPDSIAPADLFDLALVRYTVTGRGAFPVDLLRQGIAWPARASDSRQICTVDGIERVVELQGMRAPNFRKWLASSWRIVEINGVNT